MESVLVGTEVQAHLEDVLGLSGQLRDELEGCRRQVWRSFGSVQMIEVHARARTVLASLSDCFADVVLRVDPCLEVPGATWQCALDAARAVVGAVGAAAHAASYGRVDGRDALVAAEVCVRFLGTAVASVEAVIDLVQALISTAGSRGLVEVAL